MTNLRSLEQKLGANLSWNKARIKFVSRFLLALYATRTSGFRSSGWSCRALATLIRRNESRS